MLHPEARQLLDLIASRGLPPTQTLTAADARKLYLERRFFTQPDAPAVAEVKDLQAPGAAGPIPLRFYRPAVGGPALSVLVYFHGGGWVIGNIETHDVLCRQLANASGCAVVSVDYRVAPESRFPAALDDCLAATQWVYQNAASLGLNPNKLAVGGDSAGGNLAAVVALTARDMPAGPGKLPIQFQLLIYPATDFRAGSDSQTRNGVGYLLERATMDYFEQHYLAHEGADRSRRLDWKASPLLAASHANLPPALVLTAGFDPLRDEGIEYAHKMSAAGSQAVHVSYERQIHGFITMGRVLQEANAAVRLCARELAHALA